MPFIEIKMWPRELNREQKLSIANTLVKAACEELGNQPTSYTVTVEEIAKDEWADKVKVNEKIVVLDHGTVKI